MNTQENYDIVPLGDTALLVSFGNQIDLAIHKKVLELFQQIKALQSPYIKDVVPAYSSLALHYDVHAIHAAEKVETAYSYMAGLIKEIINNSNEVNSKNHPLIKIPVCYASTFALDIVEIAAQKSLSVEEVIYIHSSTVYTVFMIGFLPGFPYMGKVDSRIAMPRKTEPRPYIEGGSIGIAGEQTGIYPLTSPGGWQIIGRTPIALFRKEAKDPVLLSPGNQVQFYSITEHEFKNY